MRVKENGQIGANGSQAAGLALSRETDPKKILELTRKLNHVLRVYDDDRPTLALEPVRLDREASKPQNFPSGTAPKLALNRSQ